MSATRYNEREPRVYVAGSQRATAVTGSPIESGEAAQAGLPHPSSTGCTLIPLRGVFCGKRSEARSVACPGPRFTIHLRTPTQ